jgi:hypothetical protein
LNGQDFLHDSLTAKKMEDQSLYRQPLSEIERGEEKKEETKDTAATSATATTTDTKAESTLF